MSIKCGNCHQYHPTVADVRVCHLGREAAVVTEDDLLPCERKALETGKASPATFQTPAATEKQLAYARSLARERQLVGGDTAERFIANMDEQVWTKAQMSDVIASLLKLPKLPKATADVADAEPLEDGVYKLDGVYFMIYHTVHGANQQVAKALIVRQEDDGTWSGEWNYVGKAPLRKLCKANKLSEEEARQFGQVYGICVRCARDLTKEESKYVGYGATCAAHEGWWYPSKTELRALTLEGAK